MLANWRSCRYWTLETVLLTSSVALTLAVRGDGPLFGEVGMALWMRNNTPGVIDMFADLTDPVITDVTAPLLLATIAFLVWWRWGRYPALVVGLAGGFTGLTRLGDLVNRPRPTSAVTWSEYSFGNGGYPSGHVVFTVLILGTVAVLARRYAKPRTSSRVVGVMILLIVLTAWTRISELHHWPLDVIGGALVGCTGLGGVIWLYPRLAAWVERQPRLKHLLQL
ncbi:MAG: phosphatase PAP2 family protein [Actinomycetota bacterium]|nr:phosphatase PAP2 family protein [Actinomycetota bacterium]